MLVAAARSASIFSFHNRERSMGWLTSRPSVRCWNSAPKDRPAMTASAPKNANVISSRRNKVNVPPSAGPTSSANSGMAPAATAAMSHGSSNG